MTRPKIKHCNACGHRYPEIPRHARLGGEGPLAGYYWECQGRVPIEPQRRNAAGRIALEQCNSTLFSPLKPRPKLKLKE